MKHNWRQEMRKGALTKWPVVPNDGRIIDELLAGGGYTPVPPHIRRRLVQRLEVPAKRSKRGGARMTPMDFCFCGLLGVVMLFCLGLMVGYYQLNSGHLPWWSRRCRMGSPPSEHAVDRTWIWLSRTADGRLLWTLIESEAVAFLWYDMAAWIWALHSASKAGGDVRRIKA